MGNSCLNEEEKKEVMNMLLDYKEACSLGDEIGTCPNIKVEIDVTDKSPFFIRPYHVREEDKAFRDKEMKQLCYMGILKEGFSAYSSPVMLISRKLTKDKRVVTDFRHLNMRIAKISTSQGPVMLISRKLTKDKRVVTDFRHLNMRIAKNNLAYPLVRDMFSMLGSSRCEVLSVLDLKDAFYSLRLSENSKRYCGICLYFGSASYLYQRMPMGLNISPSIWQSYINAIVDCLQNRKYCKAIMDDLLLFTPSKRSYRDKLDILVKVLLKTGLKISPKEMPIAQNKFAIHG